MKRRPTSLRKALGGATTQAVVIIAAGAIGFGVTALVMNDDLPHTQQPTPTVEQTTGSPAALIAAHDCWTGDAPADMEGVIPGAVVVTKANGSTVYAGERMVSKALDQVFGDVDHGLTVFAFCVGGDLR